MAIKSPISTAKSGGYETRRVEGSLPESRSFPLTVIDLTSITDTETIGMPVHAYKRACVQLFGAAIGTAVIEIQCSVSGDILESLSPRLRLNVNVLTEFDFNIAPYTHLRGKVITADVQASDNALLFVFAFI